MKFWKLALAGAAASLALGGAAFAQEDTGLEVSYNVGVASDYIFRGVSQTDGPQAFAGVDLANGPIYGGAWISNVDFGDSTDAELDLYVGVTPELGPVSFDLAAIYYDYIGDKSSSDYAYAEFKVAASVPVGPVTLGTAWYYSPEFFGGVGEAVYGEVNASWDINDKWSLGGAVGSQAFDAGGDYTTWNVGVSWAATDTFGFDLRYHDSDLGCATYCGEKIVLGLKATFP